MRSSSYAPTLVARPRFSARTTTTTTASWRWGSRSTARRPAKTTPIYATAPTHSPPATAVTRRPRPDGGALAAGARGGEDAVSVDGDSSDEQLLAAYRGGDVRAFEILLARYEKPIWSFLRRFVRDAEAAEDLLQEVFLRVVRDAQESGPAWKGEAKFSTWLYTIARNLCIDRARRTAVRGSASIDGSTGTDEENTATLHERIAAPGPSTDAVVAGREAARRIDRAVAELPDDQREVFLMREVMELPFAEIASVVGVSEPTVKSRMRYALEKLRAALADLGDTKSSAAESTESG